MTHKRLSNVDSVKQISVKERTKIMTVKQTLTGRILQEINYLKEKGKEVISINLTKKDREELFNEIVGKTSFGDTMGGTVQVKTAFGIKVKPSKESSLTILLEE